MRGAIDYTHTEYLQFISGGQDFSVNRFREAPEWTGLIGGIFTFDNGVFVEASGKYTGSVFNGPDNNPAKLSDDRFIVDAKVGYDGGPWAAHVFARNLFDTRYISSRRTDARGRIGEPLVVGGVVRAKV